MTAVAIVPAAGKAERFGDQKLLATIKGEPLLGRTLRSLVDGGVNAIVVVLAPVHAERLTSAVPLLGDPRVRIAINPDPSRGMFSSIQAGLAIAEGDPIVVLPGDMPFVKPDTVAAVLAACQGKRVVVPRNGGRRGHPVAFSSTVRDAILAADPGQNLSEILKTAGLSRLEIDVDDSGILRDVDTPDDLRA